MHQKYFDVLTLMRIMHFSKDHSDQNKIFNDQIIMSPMQENDSYKVHDD